MDWKEMIASVFYVVLIVCMLGGGITWAVIDAMGNNKTNAAWRASLKFQHQEVVELRVGGEGQIIRIHDNRFHEPYLIRIRTDGGFEDRWMHEYEVKQ